MKEYVRSAVPVLYPAILFGPNKERRAEAKELLKEIALETGRLNMKERIFCLATIPLSFWTWLTAKLNVYQQPKLLRIEHPQGNAHMIAQKAAECDHSFLGFATADSTCTICSSSVESKGIRQN